MRNTINNILIISLSSFLIIGGILNNKTGTTIIQKISGTVTEQDTNIKALPEGYLFISNFTLKRNRKIKSISQDSLGVMLFADNTGITFFDGSNETHLKIKDSPNSMLKDPELNRFYIACKSGFGIIEKDKTGQYIYSNLSEKERHTENFYKVLMIDDKIYFISQHKIVSLNKKKTDAINIDFHDEFKDIDYAFVSEGKLNINIIENGIFTLQNDSIISIISKKYLQATGILFHIENEDKILIGTDNNEVLSLKNKRLKPYELSSSDYIKESIITGAVDLNDNLFAVSTLNGGTVIIDKKTSETIYTINYRTGLPDDEIFTAYNDDKNGLWVAHEYGVSRVAFDIPVRNFGNFPGIQGKVNSTLVIDSILYVATGEGLFQLSEIKSFEEVKVATDKWIKSKTKINKEEEDDIDDAPVNINLAEAETFDDKTEETGFFKRWKRRKEKKNKEIEIKTDNAESEAAVRTEPESDTEISAADETVPDNKTESDRISYKKVTEYRKIYELQSIKYSYKKIESINSKCKSLKKFNDGFFAVTNSGLYFIKDQITTPVIENTYIYDISGNKTDKMVFASTSEGLYKIYHFEDRFIPEKIENNNPDNNKLRTLYKSNDTILWAGIMNKIYRFKIINNRIASTEQYFVDTDRNEEIKISSENGKIILFTKDRAFYYSREMDNIKEYSELNDILKDAGKVFNISDTAFIISSQTGETKLINIKNTYPNLKYAWLFDKINGLNFDNNNNIWLTTRDNMIYKISPEKNKTEQKFKIYITDIKDNEGNSILFSNSIQVESDYKRLTFELSSPYYLKNDFVTYYYGIDNDNEKDYIEFSGSKLIIPELTPGSHTLFIYAVNDIHEKSETLRIKINVKPPIWQTIWFIVGVFVVFILFTSFIISSFYKRKQRKIREYNEILEIKVKERTAEIEKQKGLIQDQNVEIIKQNEQISIQNEEITGSIRYAGKIQSAALPDTDILQKYLSGFFLFYKPRDIVSGDFYWMIEAQGKLVVAAVDCTGHGVPGGFLSMLGISFLNEIVRDISRKGSELKAADILYTLRWKVINTLTTHKDSTTQDGMDMSLVIFDKENMTLNYAGANNAAYIIRNKKLSKIEADRMPIGFNLKFNDVGFKNKFVKLKEGDSVYLFSDGYADQFGGNFGKKFNSRRFRELLLHIQKFPINKQEEVVETIFDRWKNKHIQVDDILLIGLQI